MSRKNEDKRKIKKKDQDEFEKFYKKEKRENALLKIAIFLPILLCYLVNFLVQFISNYNDKPLGALRLLFIFEILFCLSTIYFEAVEWYKLKKKPKENSIVDSGTGNNFFSFLFLIILIIVFIIFYIWFQNGGYDFLEESGDKISGIISSSVSLLYILSCFLRNWDSNLEITDRMIERFYKIKRKKAKKAKNPKKQKKYKILNKNKEYMKNKKKNKYKIYKGYNKIKICKVKK